MLQSSLHPSADDGFWARAATGELRGAACLVAAPEDVLLHVIAHGWADDPAPSVRWMADAALLLAAVPGLDWECFTARPRAHRLADRVADGLRVLGTVPGVAIPRSVERTLRRTGAHPPGLRPTHPGELDAWARRTVPPGGAVGALTAARWLRATWALPRTRSVPRHAAWILARRPARLAERLGPAPVPRHPALAPVALGDAVAFTNPLAPRAMLPSGWWCPDDHGAWSRGREAIIHIALDRPARGALDVELELVPFVPAIRPVLGVTVWADGERRARWQLRDGAFACTQVVTLPAAPGRELIELRLVVDRPASPLAAGQSSDSRPLGVALRALTVRARTAPPQDGGSPAPPPLAALPVR